MAAVTPQKVDLGATLDSASDLPLWKMKIESALQQFDLLQEFTNAVAAAVGVAPPAFPGVVNNGRRQRWRDVAKAMVAGAHAVMIAPTGSVTR